MVKSDQVKTVLLGHLKSDQVTSIIHMIITFYYFLNESYCINITIIVVHKHNSNNTLLFLLNCCNIVNIKKLKHYLFILWEDNIIILLTLLLFSYYEIK